MSGRVGAGRGSALKCSQGARQEWVGAGKECRARGGAAGGHGQVGGGYAAWRRLLKKKEEKCLEVNEGFES